jgi:hypothetical protein
VVVDDIKNPKKGRLARQKATGDLHLLRTSNDNIESNLYQQRI